MDSFYELSYYENGKEQKRIVPDEDYLGCGMEVNVYKVKDEVVKLYKNYCKKIRLTKEQCDRLTKVKTKRILLPTKSLEDQDGNMLAYKMKYIKDLGESSFFKLNKEDLTKEMTLIEEDIDVLSDNSIHIRDLGDGNTIYHNGLYLIDAGSYDVLKDTPKYRDIAYRKNRDEIDEYLIKLIEEYAKKKYKDNDKVKLMIKNIKKNIYSNNLRPLEYLKNHLEDDNIDKFIKKEMKKQKYSVLVDGKKVSLEKDYQRIYFDDKKDIYLSKENKNTKLILYKTRKPAVKLSQEELDKLSSIKTDRIITPIGKVEVLNNDRIAYQINSNRNFRYNISGNDLLEEFRLLKQDALTLGDAGIYIGRITTEDVLYDDSIYIDSIEMMEVSENAKDENIEALNIFIKSMLTDILFNVTSPRNICTILNSINSENDYYIGDILEKDFNSNEDFSDCVRKMVKTRIK